MPAEGSPDPWDLVKLGERLGAERLRVFVQRRYSEVFVLDNGVLRQASAGYVTGLGVEALVEGGLGYASTNELDEGSVKRAVEMAVRTGRAVARAGRKVRLAEAGPFGKLAFSSTFSSEPADVDVSEKVGLLTWIYGLLRPRGLSSVTVSLAYEKDERTVLSSTGEEASCSYRMVGLSIGLVACSAGSCESLRDQRSMVAGWEFVKRFDWAPFAEELAETVIASLRAPHVEPGRYAVVMDNEAVGLLIHEAFGHASEADIVLSGGSVLEGLVGRAVASELVSIADTGVVEGGAFLPIDDEGTPKRRTSIVEKGVLRSYLHSLRTAAEMGTEPTGNARAASYADQTLVRQTNIFVEPGDWRPEEMLRETKRGVYVKGRGSRGGEVNTLVGSFTFTAGPSYFVENGEARGLVRGVILTGSILETLKRVDAVGRDLVVSTSVFGGCGKMGQTVRVGDGGPHVRVSEMVVGG